MLGFGLSTAVAATAEILGASVVWQTVEIRLHDGPVANNPFDPDEIRVDATFRTPQGQITVPAFWFQDYRRELVGGKEVVTKMGEPEWRVRFTPSEAGDYHATISERRGTSSAATLASLEIGLSPAGWWTLGVHD